MHDEEDIIRELKASIGTVSAPLERMRPVDVWNRAHHYRSKPSGELSGPARAWLSVMPWLVGAVVVVVGLLYVSRYGLHLKARVVQEGNAAIGRLITAKGDLEQMDFSAAQGDFAQAYERFVRAHDELGLIGTNLGTVLAKLPGGERIRTARDLIEAGRLVAEAGSSLSQAISTFSGSSALLDLKADNRTSLGQILLPIQQALGKADADMAKAAELMGSIDAADLPDADREQFESFVQRLPQARVLIDQSTQAIAFISRLSGTDRPRRYLLLFQNSSELRPTGGFPGSYGLATFEDGRLKDITADDIYNPDGQIHQLIVPPLQLQHITPSWGMRDANWFVDFPTSARKVMEFYRKGGGSAVDGVIALRPEILTEILRITGPISMPQYDMVLDADNFLPIVQSEVESKKTAAEPKRIIMDLMPLVVQRLSALPPQQWSRVLDVFRKGLASRDMLMYMDDQMLDAFIADHGWDGQVHAVAGDYLQVNVSNIKGAKADAVTDTSIKLEGWLQSGAMTHRLTLTRQHNGGHSEYGFYNKTNYSYVRVLVPKGSTLRGITGNDRPANYPLLDYTHEQVVRDPDLVRLESTYQYDPVQGVLTGEESGKTEFGFWMRIEPGQTESVQIEYAVPAGAVGSDYHLYVQRQPGLDLSDFEFALQKEGVRGIETAHPGLTTWPDSWRLHDQLQQDLDLEVVLK